MRFRDFIQTPLEAVIPYAHFLGRELNEQVNIEELFSAVLEKHKRQISFYFTKKFISNLLSASQTKLVNGHENKNRCWAYRT